MPVSTVEAQARVQAKLEELSQVGVERVLIYGAGRHTLKVGAVLGTSPVQILGIIDDRQGGTGRKLWNWPILSPEQAVCLGAQAVIISSDGMEQQIYSARGEWLESNGITVHRLYITGASEREGTGGTFTDSGGKSYSRIPGYRRQVKPGWEKMLAAEPGVYSATSPGQARSTIETAVNRVEILEKYLQIHGATIRGKNVLEIGCWDGACCFALALRGAGYVTGIDYQDYFLWNVEPQQITDEQRTAARENLLELQNITRQAVEELCSEQDEQLNVKLHIDDLVRSQLPDAQFDVICSWQTLEHLVPPEAGFAAIARLLKPGGVCFHEYGAFTARKGGHCLCTLDFPWGHVRLSEADMDRYFKQCRSDEYEHAIRHYRRFLNRLTLADVEQLAQTHGLTLLDKTVWLNRQQFENEFDPDFLEDARRHYPTIAFKDMIHDDIWLLLRKSV